VLRVLLERRTHQAISKGNDDTLARAVEGGIERLRRASSS
jgi:hypothetical protein